MRGNQASASRPFLHFGLVSPPPPDASPDTFNEIENNLKFLDNENKEIILLGDTNCDILPNLRKGDCADACANLPTHSSRLLEVYNLFGFQQLIDRGTRETLTSNTLIDHIATTNKSNIVTFGVHETSISDHYMVSCVRKFRGASRRQHKNISTRQLKNFNSADFIHDLLSIDWNGIVNNNDDVNLIVEQWTSSFSLILEKHAPLRERRVSDKFCPWLTKDLKLMSAARDKLKKQAVRSNSEIMMQVHRQMRNKVNKLNTESKRVYFSNKIGSHSAIVETLKTHGRPLILF